MQIVTHTFVTTLKVVRRKVMKKPEEIAWEMFEKTGKTGYYMLYKKLKGGNVKE